MDKKEKLELLFKEFPGVGPRQAKRFVYSLLYKNDYYINELSGLILAIKKTVTKCPDCGMFFEKKTDNVLCHICLNIEREQGKIMIIEKNTDLENIEKSGVWNGLYFLTGRKLKINKKDESLNLSALLKKIEAGEVKEVVFALAVNPEGENTKEHIYNILHPLSKDYNFKISELGRGLSLGSELEYSDKITLANALEHRNDL